MGLPRQCLDCGKVGKDFYRGRCPTCAAKVERARGTRQQRGYGSAHQQARAHLSTLLPCYCRCGKYLTEGSDWVAAHIIDGHPEHGYHPPSCRACNEADKQR